MFKQRLFLLLAISLFLLVACTAQTEPKPARKAPTHFPTREEQPAPEQGTQKQGQQNPAADQLERGEQPASEQPEESEQLTYPDPVPADYYGSWRIGSYVMGSGSSAHSDAGSAICGQILTLSPDACTLMNHTLYYKSCQLISRHDLIAYHYPEEQADIIQGVEWEDGTLPPIYAYHLRSREDAGLLMAVLVNENKELFIHLRNAFPDTPHAANDAYYRLEQL